MGGVGKTQLAAAHARQVWEAGEVDLLVWIAANSRNALLDGLAQAAREVLGVDDPPQQAAARLLAWLADTERRWLVVFDDIQLPSDVAGLWPQTGKAGRVVATTRRRDAALGQGRHVVNVDVFTAGEAASYLRRKLIDYPDRLDEADELATDLGFLPLALAQAVAFMTDRGLSCANYRRRLVARRLEQVSPELSALPDGHRDTIAATWSLSLDAADQLHPVGLAGKLLAIAALLDPNGIPISVLTSDSVLSHVNAYASDGAEWNTDDLSDALHNLHRLSLITLNPDTAQARVHALIQRTTRDQLTTTDTDTATRATADALDEQWQGIRPEQMLLYRNNAEHLTACAPDTLLRPRAHPVLFRIGNDLGQGGQVARAAAYFVALHQRLHNVLGPDHPDTLATRADLAHWRGSSGDLTGAADEFRALLDDHLRILSPDHPNILATRANLARLRGQSGDPTGAADEFRALLDEQLRILSPDHPNPIATRANLAHLRGQSGDPAGAADEFRALLKVCLRVLGPDHPNTLTARAHLARWRGNSGDLTGAIDELRALLDDQLRVLGPNHPSTLTARSNLGRWRGDSGDLTGAIDELRALLDDQLRVLGPNHPSTLAARANLAHLRGQSGDPAGAADELRSVLDDHLRVLGPDHPNTLTARAHLAHWRGNSGDPAGAADELRALLDDYLRVLGPDHPNTLTSRSNLAHWRGQVGAANESPCIASGGEAER